MSRSVDISDSVGSANFTCVVMNSDVSSSCHIVAVTVHADIQNDTYMFCYSRTVVPSRAKRPLQALVVYINQPRVQTYRNQYR